jgi:hypothetical protein
MEKKNYHLVSKKERWGLTRWGWLLLLTIFLLLNILFFANLYKILAPVEREKTDILVLEGFISDDVMETAIKEFKDYHYQLLITTGTPLEWGHLLVEYNNTAILAGASLLKLGFDSTKLVMVGTKEIRNDRTYNSALELKSWLSKNRPDVKSINLMTMSVHGARSRKMFQEALGDTIRVGIISLKNFYYGPGDWWKSSKGFRETMNEAIGYFYVKFFFQPYTKPVNTK